MLGNAAIAAAEALTSEDARVAVVDVDFPYAQHALLRSVEGALRRHRGRVRLVVLDHITSCPSVCVPVERLVTLCRAAGARVLVDGAHAVGSVTNS